jgi:membrane protease YdiL (CAAX protease family)
LQAFDSRAIGPFGILHLVFFGLWIPLAAFRSKRKLEDPLAYPARKVHFASTLILQLAFGGISIAIAQREWIDLFAPYSPTALHIGLGALALASMIAFMAPRWRRNVERRLKKIDLFSPRDGLERTLWIAVSIAAGIGEELTYRGVMFTLLLRWTGVPDLAVLIAAVVFSISHLVQGWRAALVIFAFAIVFHVLVMSTGTLFVAMGVHVLYDITAGMVYGTLCRRRDARDARDAASVPHTG